MNNLKELNIKMTLQEIREMSKTKYKEMIKFKCDELAYKYLTSRKGSKGKEIDYSRIEMSQYLQPNDILKISEQKQIFEIRNKMTNISANYPGKMKNEHKCFCGQAENMEHIYYCSRLNNTEIKIEYVNIYKGNISNMKTILERFKENMNKREMFSHVIQNCDPPG